MLLVDRNRGKSQSAVPKIISFYRESVKYPRRSIPSLSITRRDWIYLQSYNLGPNRTTPGPTWSLLDRRPIRRTHFQQVEELDTKRPRALSRPTSQDGNAPFLNYLNSNGLTVYTGRSTWMSRSPRSVHAGAHVTDFFDVNARLRYKHWTRNVALELCTIPGKTEKIYAALFSRRRSTVLRNFLSVHEHS